MKYFILFFSILAIGCNLFSPSAKSQLEKTIKHCEKSHGLGPEEVSAMKTSTARLADSLQKTDPAQYKKLLPTIEKAQVWLRHAEVLVVHDHCMPQMGNMVELKNQLESLKNLPKPAADSVKAAANALVQADEAMMGWMHKFRADVPRQRIQYTTAITYLDEQYAIISRVDSQIFASMDNAKMLLKRYQNAQK